MAAGLGFKDFATGEVLTAADVDGYLMQGIWVFASATARDAAVTSPQEGNACYLKDTNQVLTYNGSAWVAVGGGSPLTTKGDLYGFSTVDARIPVGTNGHILTADSTETLGVKWAAPAGGGKILQVVSTAKTDTFASTSSNTFLDVTGLSVTITPSSASSTILIIADVNFGTNGLSGYGFIRLVRDSTAICIGDTAGSRTSGSNGSASASADVTFALGLNFKDSPATTSAVTYKIQMFAQNAGQTAYINRSHTDGNGAGGLRGASTITAMEIGA